MRGNTITMHMVYGRIAQAGNLWQYDYGQRLLIAGVDLPAVYEVHFSNAENGQSKTMIGDDTGVDIPDEYLLSGEKIHVWVYLHNGESDGETEYHGIINVAKRAKPTDQAPTPVQQDVIDQAIAALNAGVTEVEGIAEGIPQTIDTALAEAKASGEFDGKDGKDGKDGTDGADGYSPTATVTKSGKVATITITDKNGTTTETVSDGADADPTTLIDDTAGEGDTNKTWSADKLTRELTAATMEEVQAIIDAWDEEDDGMIVEMTRSESGWSFISDADAADIATAFMTGKNVVLHFQESESSPDAYVQLVYYAPAGGDFAVAGFAIAKPAELDADAFRIVGMLNAPRVNANGKLEIAILD